MRRHQYPPLDKRSRCMLREFKDSKGVDWLVWDVYPTGRSIDTGGLAAGAAFPSRELADGWLCFESASEKRRVTPIPHGWEELPPPRLEELCRNAGYVSRGGRNSGDIPVVRTEKGGEAGV